MVKRKKKKGFLQRVGPRYGRKLKEKVEAVEKEQKKAHKCPYCNKLKVRRLSAGIWFCTSCEAKFAGKAFTKGSKPALKVKENKFAEA